MPLAQQADDRKLNGLRLTYDDALNIGDQLFDKGVGTRHRSAILSWGGVNGLIEIGAHSEDSRFTK